MRRVPPPPLFLARKGSIATIHYGFLEGAHDGGTRAARRHAGLQYVQISCRENGWPNALLSSLFVRGFAFFQILRGVEARSTVPEAGLVEVPKPDERLGICIEQSENSKERVVCRDWAWECEVGRGCKSEVTHVEGILG